MPMPTPIWWAYELANHILKPILDIFKTSDLAYSSSSCSSPLSSPSSDDAYGVLLCDNDDWIRSSRSAATRANSSHWGSGVLPANNFSSSKSHQLCVNHTINSQSLIFDLCEKGVVFLEMDGDEAFFVLITQILQYIARYTVSFVFAQHTSNVTRIDYVVPHRLFRKKKRRQLEFR